MSSTNINEENPLCDYCNNEATFLEVLSSNESEELILDNYNFYVCQDHKGAKHLEKDVKNKWRANR